MKNRECSIVRDILPLYVENVISDDTKQFVDEHLSHCTECKNELELSQTDIPIKKNCYYSHLKKQKNISKIEGLELEDLVDPNLLIDEKIITHEQTVQIQKVLHTIPEPYKEVFMWRVFADLNFKQIGQIFNKTDNWACVTYHRAKNQILKGMEEQKNEKS